MQIDVTSVFGAGGIRFFGTDYTDIFINSNGAITFGSACTSYDQGGVADFSVPALLPFYSDINIGDGGEIFWDIDPANSQITVTWDAVAPYSGTGTNSFQVVLTDAGGDTILGGAGNDTIQSGSNGGVGGGPTWTAVAGGAEVIGTSGQDYYQYNGGGGTSAVIRLNNSADAGDGDGVADYVHVTSTDDNVTLTVGDFNIGTDQIVLSDGYSITSSSFDGTSADLTA